MSEPPGFEYVRGRNRWSRSCPKKSTLGFAPPYVLPPLLGATRGWRHELGAGVMFFPCGATLIRGLLRNVVADGFDEDDFGSALGLNVLPVRTRERTLDGAFLVLTLEDLALLELLFGFWADAGSAKASRQTTLSAATENLEAILNMVTSFTATSRRGQPCAAPRRRIPAGTPPANPSGLSQSSPPLTIDATSPDRVRRPSAARRDPWHESLETPGPGGYPPAEATMKIVSLLASGTEIASALGLEDEIVGISHECDHPPRVLDRPRISRPRFDPAGLDSGQLDAAVREAMASSGSVYAIDEEAIERLDPDLILTQAVCDVCAVPASDAQRAVARLGDGATVLSLDAHTIDGIFHTILQVGEAAGIEERARTYVDGLRERIERVRERVAGRERPRLLAIEWLDPPFVPGHWVPEMVEAAGAVNLAGAAGERSDQVEWAEVSGLDPDVLVVMPCGYKLEAARADADRHTDRLLEAAPRAIRDGRAFVVDASSYFNRSGPRVVDGIEILAALLHPDLFPEADLAGRGAIWRPPSADGA